MGLGKTVQAIAAAELFARHFGVQRVLVVCPTSLKHQWKNEFTRFAAREVQVVHGLRAHRQAQYREEFFCRVVNYEMLARDADLIDAWAPELVMPTRRSASRTGTRWRRARSSASPALTRWCSPVRRWRTGSRS
jgi:N12 class adenine-specific DNA methylase